MRFTWLSNCPWTPTGYGQQTALFTPRITNAGHPVGVISTYGHQGNAINWNGVQVFGNSFHPYAMDIMHGHSKTFNADALITMIDVQVMELEGLLGTPWLPWFPVDHATIPPVIFDKISKSYHPIAMSKSACVEMDKTNLDYSYVPCGIDTKVFKPSPMIEAREEMKLPADKFIVGMVAMNKGNPSRKAFHQNIAAFAALKQKYGDCVLYLHTIDGSRNGYETVDLISYCKALGLSYGYAFTEQAQNVDVIFADQYGMTLGYDPAMMAKLYSSFDVHLLVTMGEGFGIPIIEAQACGCPVIVGDWSSMPELVFSGWKVDKKDAEPIYTNLQAFQYLPRAVAIAEKLDAAYQMRGNQDYRHRAIAGPQMYDADRIMTKYWLPTIEKIAGKLQEAPADMLDTKLGMLR